MKVRYEEGNLLADFNYRECEPLILVTGLDEDDWNVFVNMCKTTFVDERNIDDIDLKDVIFILMNLSVNYFVDANRRYFCDNR